MTLPSTAVRRLSRLRDTKSLLSKFQSIFTKQVLIRHKPQVQYFSNPVVTCHSMSPPALKDATNPSTSTSRPPRIHILGLGNIGKLFAHSLARLSPPPPLTLLLHRPELVEAFANNEGAIEIITNGKSHKVTGFDIEILGVPCEQPITNLIVATKATHTLAAITAVRCRLSEKSSIVFAQNGKGTTEEITTNLFPDPATRPAYLPTVMWHGIHSTSPFSSIHAGVGYLSISAPADRPQARYLLDSVVGVPAMHARETTEDELLAQQLEKLILNTVLNPVTAIFRVLNGEMVTLPPLARLWRAMLLESSTILRAWPGIQAVEDIENRFGFEMLTTMIIGKCEMTAKNKSSMLQDVEAGRGLEIQYINGWLVARGKELGAEVKLNERVMQILKEGRRVNVDEVAIKEEFGELE